MAYDRDGGFYVPLDQQALVAGCIALLVQGAWPRPEEGDDGRAYREDLQRLSLHLLSPVWPHIGDAVRIMRPNTAGERISVEMALYLLGVCDEQGRYEEDGRLRIGAGI